MSDNTTRNEMEQLAGRAEQLISALSNAILSTAEVAAERLELASKVAQVNQRLAAFSAVLDSIAAQREALETRMTTAKGAQRLLLQRQLDLLAAQEVAVLSKAGLDDSQARQALEVADEPSYHRSGRRFVRSNGNSES
jgi:hypothetical protein